MLHVYNAVVVMTSVWRQDTACIEGSADIACTKSNQA